jgi:hypothetical protein
MDIKTGSAVATTYIFLLLLLWTFVKPDGFKKII